MGDWVSDPAPYVSETDPNPIALSPETYKRHAAAVDDVLGANRARYPRPSRGRTTSANAGIWARLASGSTISAASGLVLGTGTVKLCSRNEATLLADGQDVTVYNAGEAITAEGGDKIVKLSWSDGVWAANRCS